MLKSRNIFPPGGFKFHQAQTGWDAPGGIGFNATVAAIIQHRKANPRFNLPTDRVTVETELESVTEARIRSMPGASTYLVDGVVGEIPKPLPPRPRAVAPAAGANVKAGIGLLVEWIGEDLKPVSIEMATRRASVCAGCPLNQKPSLVQRAYGAVADGLHKLMEAKAEMKLRTPHDAALHTCSACDCKLDLKVFVPIKHVMAHTSDTVRGKLYDGCWILAESK